MTLQPCRRAAPRRPPLRFEKLLERRLGVDDDLLAARQVDDQVRTKPAVLGEQSGLLVEVAALQHARHLDDAPELELAPSAADRRRAQRARQRVADEPRATICSDRRAYDSIRSRSTSPSRCVDSLQRVGDRLPVGLERRLREIEEGRAIVVERLRGERLKGLAHPLVGLVEKRLLRLRRVRRGRRRAPPPADAPRRAAHDDRDDAAATTAARIGMRISIDSPIVIDLRNQSNR